MVTHYGLDDSPLLKYSVLEWSGSVQDHDALASINYVVNGDGDLLLWSMEDTPTGVITRSTLVEPGERIIVTPLGWMGYSQSAEDLFKSVLGEM